MNNLINYHLAKAIIDCAIFLEFTDENLLDADTSIDAMEQLAMELQKMDEESRKNLVQCFKKISVEYQEERKIQFVEGLAEFFGL